MRAVIGALRLTLFLLASMVTLIFQSTLMLFTKGPAALVYPRLFHAQCTRILGIKVIVEGTIAQGSNIVYVGNHISYLDIPVVGSVVKGSFVAKKDVESWPFFGIMGKMGRTVYMSRSPADAEESTRLMLDRLNEPSPLIIFPEGTSSAGMEILPFKSSLFEIFLNRKTLIQPFTISLIEMEGAPVASIDQRNKYSWYGDMTLPPHLWAIAKGLGCTVKLTFQEPVLSSSFQNRKLLSSRIYGDVVKGLDLSGAESYGLNRQTEMQESSRSNHASHTG
jgi:1-acyl-sn-glycerol-3-phosphate acyltransferase